MSNQEVETSSSKSDLLLVTLAALLAIAGVVGFALLSEEALACRGKAGCHTVSGRTEE